MARKKMESAQTLSSAEYGGWRDIRQEGAERNTTCRFPLPADQRSLARPRPEKADYGDGEAIASEMAGCIRKGAFPPCVMRKLFQHSSGPTDETHTDPARRTLPPFRAAMKVCPPPPQKAIPHSGLPRGMAAKENGPFPQWEEAIFLISMSNADQAANERTFSDTTETRVLIGCATSPASFSMASLALALSFAKASKLLDSSSL